PFSFADWYSLQPWSKWKIDWYGWGGDFALVAKKKVQEEYGIATPYAYMPCRQGDYSRNDWILCFSVRNRLSIDWMTVDFVVRVSKLDKKAYDAEYPYQAVQALPLAHYPPPPFLIDKKFKDAFRAAIDQYGIEKLKSLTTKNRPKWLMDFVFQNY
ncbi:MAG TPA: hypothetical protein VMP08_13490, partial [Anaerolineae bacterium]|nr:hypothetical protein [Anaerolineae bacterium]